MVRLHDLGAPPQTLSDEADRHLRRDVIAGRLVPGSRLRIDRLKVAYDIGASPLREALSRLASEGSTPPKVSAAFAPAHSRSPISTTSPACGSCSKRRRR
jgi:hypothetical protein